MYVHVKLMFKPCYICIVLVYYSISMYVVYVCVCDI